MAVRKVAKKAGKSEEEKVALQTGLSDWEQGVRQPSLAAKPERKSEFKTLSNFPVNPLYTPLDVEGIDYLRDIGFPGQYPFTRGQTPNGYRSHDFRFAFYSGYGTPESTNKRHREYIARGATHLMTAFDLPTQMGLDPDDIRAKGEVGKVGVSLPSLQDAGRICEGIDLRKVDMEFGAANCIAAYSLALLLSVAEKRHIEPGDLPKIENQNDPLKEYTGRGTYILPPSIAVELATDVREYMLRNLHNSQVHTGLVCTTQIAWGGCSASQELGYALAHFVTYIDSALRRGLKLEEFIPRMEWHATSDLDIFQEAAKFRAGRKLFARLIKERYHCDDPNIQALRITSFISAQRLTAQQPLNNLCRITMGVLASILGGLHQVLTPAYDEAIALPTEESGRIGNLVKFVILHECGLDGVIDPLGGSYYLEKLTRQTEEEAQFWFHKIEDMGGALSAIEKGLHYQEELKGLYRERREIASGERVVIGVNKFRIEEEKLPEIFQVDPGEEEKQIKRLQKLREERDNPLVKEKLDQLGEVATKKSLDNKVNIVPSIKEAVKAYATVGEIYGVLRRIYGEFEPPTHM